MSFWFRVPQNCTAMKVVLCLALVFAVVAADFDNENAATPENILKDTTFVSSSTPSSPTYETTGAAQQRDFSFGAAGASFGSGGSWSGFRSQAPGSVSSRSGSGFSESSSFGVDGDKKDESSVSGSLGGAAASGAAALANGAFKGSNNAFLKSTNGFAWNSASPIYGFNGLNDYAHTGRLGSTWGNGVYYSGYNPLVTSYTNGYGNSYGNSLSGIHGYSGYNPLITSYTNGYGNSYGNVLTGIHGHSNVDTQVRVDTTQQKHVNTLHTITKQVAVPEHYPVPVPVTKTVAVPHPYPVEVPKEVPVPYNVNVPVPVDKPIPVRVPVSVPVPFHVNVPVPVDKPYPVQVEKIVRVPVEKPVYVRVPHPVAVKVAQPYPVRVAKPVPVQVPTPVVVKVPEVVNIHKVDYASVPSYGVNYAGLYGNQGLYGVHSLYGAQYGAGVVSGEYGLNQALHASQFDSHNYLNNNNQVYVSGSAAHVGSLADDAYEIQPANLVGGYQFSTTLDAALHPEVVDAKFAFKRETTKKVEKKVEEKKEEKKH